MASVKSLFRSPSQSHCSINSHYEQKVPLAKSHSFSGSSLTQGSSNLFNRKIFSSSFDSSAHRRLASVYMLQLLTPITTPSSVYDCYSHISNNNFKNSPLTSLETSVDSLVHNEIRMPSLNISCPVLASADGIEMSVQQPCSLDSVVPSDSLHYPVMMNSKKSFLCSTVNNSNKLSASKENIQNNTTNSETKIMVAFSTLGESKVSPSCSHGNVTSKDNSIEKSEESAKKSSSVCDYLAFGKSRHRDGSSKSTTQEKDINVGSSVDASTQVFTLKPLNNLAHVLSAPRKIAKKGRPSSKKQKKRKREKSKRESSPLQTKEVSSASKVNSQMKQSHLDSGSLEFTSVLSHELDNPSRSPTSNNNHSKELAPVNATSRFCPTACLLFRLKSSSEDVDDDDSDGCSEWSVSEQNSVCISPIDGYGFNFALTLDSIFKNACAKENEPSPSYAKAGVCQDLKQRLFERNSFDDTDFEICASPVSTEFTDNDYITHLPEDIWFPTELFSKNQTATNLENAVEFIDDYASADKSSILMIGGQETDFETLDKINSEWNKHYPTTGFHGCNPGDDIIGETSIKVHFAAEPHLLTVYILEEEDRTGPWQHFAVDRERFERRILELERVISPVLDADHRVKILEHRLHPKKQ